MTTKHTAENTAARSAEFSAEFTADDARWMQRALELARQGVGLASPNPTVGCVIVKDGATIGEGFHRYEQRDHAEVVALKQAGVQARDTTVYVTLEPCSHTGRTPPCTDALIAAGVKRVFAATLDPNPAVRGQGLEQLRAAGIATECGLMQTDARSINNAFAKFIRTGLPFVTLKAALSRDGMIAPQASERKLRETFWLTGELARAEVHHLRHAADAVLTGIGTVLADDPLLTDRSGLERHRPLLRVVLDSSLNTPLDSKLVRSANQDVFAFCSNAADPQRQTALEQAGVQVVRAANAANTAARLVLRDVLHSLGQLGVTHLLLEAGTRLNGTFLKEDLVDDVVLFRAPIFLGSNAAPFAEGQTSPEELEKRVLHPTREMFDRDECVRGLLHDPWAGLD